VSLTDRQIALVKGMLLRGDHQHHISALFGVDAGRIAEVKAGMPGVDWRRNPTKGKGRVAIGAEIEPAPPDELPPPGPYFLNLVADRDIILDGLEAVEEAVALHAIDPKTDRQAALDMQRRYHNALAERRRELWKGRQR
jgi:hypothetical protein